MNSRVLSGFICVCTIILLSTAANAAIQLVDKNFGGDSGTGANFTEGNVETGTGSPGDLEIIFTSTTSKGTNYFTGLVPGNWNELDQGGCGNNDHCILGLYSRIDDSSGSSDITFGWANPADIWIGASLRYKGTDPDNPVTAYACDTGYGVVATAPSVVTDGHSTVIRVAVFGWDYSIKSVDVNEEKSAATEELFAGVFTTINEFLYLKAYSEEFPHGGPTGTAEVGGIYPQDWRACTIALRAAPTSIPTLSEWGMGVFAALFGILSIWALRRRTARAL